MAPSRSRSRSRSPRRSRSRSRSRSDSRRRSRSRSSSRDVIDEIQLTDSDAAFVLGRGGQTKQKLARVSGAQLELFERDLVLEIRGSEVCRKRARRYVELVMAQRVGPVYLNLDEDIEDLTIVEVPTECIGYVTGRKGATMRQIEADWGTLMFFAEPQGSRKAAPDHEMLAIFGDRRGRRGAELKVMSAVETKMPGHFTKGVEDHNSDSEWGTDTLRIGDAEISYALGAHGSTRKKLARASGAVMEYVGGVAFISGYDDERKAAREYLGWLMAQRVGPVHVSGVSDRRDVVVVEVPQSCMGYVTGARGASLRNVEERTGTFCFVDSEGRDNYERLLIFGCDRRGREHARSIVENMVSLKSREDARRGDRGRGDRDRDRGRGDRDRRRSRSRSRSRSRDRGRRRSHSRSSRSRSRSRSRGRRSRSRS